MKDTLLKPKAPDQLQVESGASAPICSARFVRCPKVDVITKERANEMLDKWHYLGALRTSIISLGFDGGCTVWGVLRSRAWHKSLIQNGFAPLELIRMVGEPDHKWATSSLLANSAKLIFSLTNYDSLVTYADPMQGHSGSVYRATNWNEIERAQPDGYVWRLDGKIVSRKRFYAEFGTSSISVVRQHYGDRLTMERDIPKHRFFFLKRKSLTDSFKESSRKKKTWGAARILKQNKVIAK